MNWYAAVDHNVDPVSCLRKGNLPTNRYAAQPKAMPSVD